MAKNNQRRARLKDPYRNLLPPHSREEYDALRASVNLSAAQKKALLQTMKTVAAKLREEDRRRNTHKRIAGLLGVARQTVATWLWPSGIDMHGAENGALNESALWADSRYAAVRHRLWAKKVHLPLEEHTLAAIRRSSASGLPYGGDRWVQGLAKKLDLDLTIRPRGRPRKERETDK